MEEENINLRAQNAKYQGMVQEALARAEEYSQRLVDAHKTSKEQQELIAILTKERLKKQLGQEIEALNKGMKSLRDANENLTKDNK